MKTSLKLAAAALLVVTVVNGGAAAAASAPSAPRYAKATPANQAVKVSWTAPSSNGGATIDQYALQRLNTTTSTWSTIKSVSGSARSATSTGLTNGKRYYFRVRAHNAAGWSTASSTVNAVPRTVPSAPRYTRVTVTDTTATLTWQAPSTNGGAVIDSYRVERSSDGVTFGSALSTGLLTATLTGLTPGNEYWFRVRAHNAAGYGSAAGIGPKAAIGVPGIPGLTGIAGDGAVDLTLVAPSPGHSPVDVYRLEGSYPGLGWIVLDYRDATYAESEGTVWAVQGLTNGESYRFRVRAHNEAGYGPAYETEDFTPTGVPEEPLAAAGYGTPSGVYVSWDPPTSDGGLTIDKYEVLFLSTSDAVYYETLQTTELNVTQENAVLGDYYWVTVRAHNAHGWGPESDPVLIQAGTIPG